MSLRDFCLFLLAATALHSKPAGAGNCPEDVVPLRNQYFRSPYYQPSPSDILHCDRPIMPGKWYQFVSTGGGTIPTSCVDLYNCGTKYPIWLLGETPSEHEGPVNRELCVMGNSLTCDDCKDALEFCCDEKLIAEVYNCTSKEGQVVIYKLPRPSGCPMAFCAGSKPPCPHGTSSFTGYPPGCSDAKSDYVGVPKVDVYVGTRPKKLPPSITGRDKLIMRAHITRKKKEIQFRCNIPDDKSKNYTNMFFNVRWFIDDGFDKLEVAYEELGEGQRVSILHEYHWMLGNDPKRKLPFEVYCEVLAHFNKTGFPSQWRRSAKFWAGIEVKTKVIRVKEGQTADVQLRSSIPMLDLGCDADGGDYFSGRCFIGFELRSLRRKNNMKACVDKEPTPIVTKGCQQKFNLRNHENVPDYQWKKNEHGAISFNLKSTIDGQYTFQRKRVLKLGTPKRVNNHRLWSNYIVHDVEVLITDSDAEKIKQHICSSRNDPHMITFDGHRYESHKRGEFILYRNTKFPLEVHGLFQSCYGYLGDQTACNCGVAVRSATDVFVIESCNKKNSYHAGLGMGKRRLRLNQSGKCDSYGRGTQLFRKNDGNNIEIHLPSGTIIEASNLKSKYMNIHITPSLVDYEHTEGLCGSFNGVCEDDLVYETEDGKTKNDGKKNSKECSSSVSMILDGSALKNDFTEHWRVSPENSLFSGNFKPENTFLTYSNHKYCVCNETAGNDIVCGPYQYVQVCKSKGKDITSRHLSKCRRKRETDFHDYVEDEEELIMDFDPNFEPAPMSFPTASGRTYLQAKSFCENYVYNSSITKTCGEIADINFEEKIASCIQDIKLTDSTEWAITALASIQKECMTEVEKNTTLWVVDEVRNGTGNDTSNGNGTVSLANDTSAFPEVTFKFPTFVMDVLCPNECSGQGTCNDGQCDCETGFLGSDCSVEKAKPPLVYAIPRGGLCDVRGRPCEGSPVYGDNFVETENLTCHVDYLKINKDGSFNFTGEKAKTKGEFETFNEVFCLLPKSRVRRSIDNRNQGTAGIPASGFNIGISNDGVTVSERVTFISYDSTCLHCNSSGYCFKKENSCLIGGFCFAPGESNTMNDCQVCSAAKDPYGWSSKYDKSCLIDGVCVLEGNENPSNPCKKCSAVNNATNWTSKYDHACVINGECVQNGTTNPLNACQLCVSNINPYNWSDTPYQCNTTPLSHTTKPKESKKTSTLSNGMKMSTTSQPPPSEKKEDVVQLQAWQLGLIIAGALLIVCALAVALGIAVWKVKTRNTKIGKIPDEHELETTRTTVPT